MDAITIDASKCQKLANVYYTIFMHGTNFKTVDPESSRCKALRYALFQYLQETTGVSLSCAVVIADGLELTHKLIEEGYYDLKLQDAIEGWVHRE
jgi:hypothetical protein